MIQRSVDGGSCVAVLLLKRGSVAKTKEGHRMKNPTFGVCSSQGGMIKLPISVFFFRAIPFRFF